MLCARYLGPSNYGLINYATAIVSFAVPIMRLGFDGTLVNELIEHPEKEGAIMGTSLAMTLCSAIVCCFGVNAFAYFANADDFTTFIVCLLFSLVLIFTALETIQYWFQYKLISKYSSIVMLISYTIASGYRVFLLVTEKSVQWFALTNSLDIGIIAIVLIIIYFKRGAQPFSFSFSLGKKMLARSKHFILASLLIHILQNIDRIMLTSIKGNAETGFFSAAVTTAALAQFVYVAIIDSYRPLIFSNKNTNIAAYEKNISGLYCIITYMAIAQGIVFTVFAPLIINILYGAEYSAAIPVLQVLVWYIAFSIMGGVRNIWLLAEEKQKYLWRINLFGVVANIVMNIVLIPNLGAIGAAIASLATQMFINFGLGFVMKPIRSNNVLMLKGLSPKFAYNFFKATALQLLKKH
jgi:O-antigen/teichoic acid export membrane protein